MIFWLVCFLGHCSDSMCDLFRYRRAIFHSAVRTISMRSFWWQSIVNDEVTVSLQDTFLFTFLVYDIDNSFFIISYCQKKLSLYFLLILFLSYY